jgi:hypothetical protein
MRSQDSTSYLTEREREHLVREVACPRCDAPAGQHCLYGAMYRRFGGGRGEEYAHVARYELAAVAGLVPPLRPMPGVGGG